MWKQLIKNMQYKTNEYINLCTLCMVQQRWQCVPLEGSPGKCWLLVGCLTCNEMQLFFGNSHKAVGSHCQS
jgi:hypothetical protein